MSTGNSTIREAAAIVIQILLEAKENTATRRFILSKHFSDFDSELLDKTMTTLENGGLIVLRLEGTEVSYKLTRKALDLYTNPAGSEGGEKK